MLIDYPFIIVASTLPSFAIGATVLRYGLWDINFILSRTVLCGTLTAILAAVFAASALVLGPLKRDQSYSRNDLQELTRFGG